MVGGVEVRVAVEEVAVELGAAGELVAAVAALEREVREKDAKEAARAA